MRRPRLADISSDPARNGLYRISADAAPANAGLLRVSGRRLTSKGALLATLGQTLDFPNYFGHNWDALEDCLFDLGWWSGPVLLLIDDAGMPEACIPEAWGEALEILEAAAQYWRQQGRPFCILLAGSGAKYPRIDVA